MSKKDRIAELEKELTEMRVERDFHKAAAARFRTFYEAVRAANVTLESTFNPHWHQHSSIMVERTLCQPDKSD